MGKLIHDESFFAGIEEGRKQGRVTERDRILTILGKARLNSKCKECEFNFKMYQEIKEPWRIA